MSKWRENLFYRLLSVALAVGLWWYVTDQQNPVTERVFSVPLEVRGLDEQLVVAEKPATVQIRVQGNKRQIQEISSTDLDSWADLRGLKAGERIVEVGVSLPRGVTLVNIQPSQVKITLDQITEIELPLRVQFDAVETEPGFKILEAVVKPSQVLVSGPRSVLEEIEEVYVRPTLENELRADWTGVLPIQIKNGRRETLHDWLKVLPATAEVYLPVVPNLPHKNLPIAVTLIGDLPEGYSITRVAVIPNMATVYAPQSLLDSLEVVTTRPIDVSKVKETGNFRGEIDLPDGAYSSVGERVTISLEVASAENTSSQ